MHNYRVDRRLAPVPMIMLSICEVLTFQTSLEITVRHADCARSYLKLVMLPTCRFMQFRKCWMYLGFGAVEVQTALVRKDAVVCDCNSTGYFVGRSAGKNRLRRRIAVARIAAGWGTSRPIRRGNFHSHVSDQGRAVACAQRRRDVQQS